MKRNNEDAFCVEDLSASPLISFVSLDLISSCLSSPWDHLRGLLEVSSRWVPDGSRGPPDGSRSFPEGSRGLSDDSRWLQMVPNGFCQH